MIDALIRKSQSEFGPDKDVYAKRFQKVLVLASSSILTPDILEYAANISASFQVSNFEHRQRKMQKDRLSLAQRKNLRRELARRA